jgi:hypothetical protein
VAAAAAAAAAAATGSSSSGGGGGGGTVPPALGAAIKRQLSAHAALAGLVTAWRLDDAWRLKPLLNGTQIVKMLGLRNGPDVGRYVDELTRWQLLHPPPHGDAAAAEAFLRALQGAGGAPAHGPPGLERVSAALVGGGPEGGVAAFANS